MTGGFELYNHKKISLGQMLNLIYFHTVRKNFFNRFKNIYNDNRLSGGKMLSAMFYLTPVPPPDPPPT